MTDGIIGVESPITGTCNICHHDEPVVCETCSTFDDPAIEPTDNDRAFQILIESLSFYEDLNKGSMLAAAAENLKSAAELTGVQPTIILYAQKFGTLRAHNLFLKKQFQVQAQARERTCPTTPPTPEPPSVVSP